MKSREPRSNEPRQEMEREQRIIYLKQAFCAFFRAKQGVEMENLGRVICAILGLTPDEQTMVMENISKWSSAVMATSTIETITYNFTSLFG